MVKECNLMKALLFYGSIIAIWLLIFIIVIAIIAIVIKIIFKK